MRALTPAAIAEINKLASGGVFLWLLAVTHPDLSPLYLVNNTKDITSNGIIYTAFPFTIKLMDEVRNQFTSASLMLSNVDLEAVKRLRSISAEAPATFTASLILASQPNSIVLGPISWINKEATGNYLMAEIELGLRSLRGLTFPRPAMDPEAFPALHRTF